MDFAMDTSLYTIQPFDIHCSQYNFIDLDNSHFFVSPIHEEEIYRNAFPPLADHSTSSNTLKDHHDFYDDHLQSLVFLDSDINHSPNTSASDISPDSDFPLVQDDEIGCQGVDECSVLLDNDPYLSSIQEKLTKEGSITDLLLIGAQAVEAEKCQLASAVISRLTHLLLEPQAERSPFNRLALYFTQGLETKIFGVKAPSVPASMPAFQMLQELTPYVKFPHFTANQAILEASKGKTELHIIDFDVMEGIQWPPLMVDLALRKNIFMRITAVVDNSNAAMVQQTGRRLREFAESISLSFIFDQTILEEGQLRGVQLSPSSILIANCMFNQLHNRTFASVSSFLSGVTRLSPKMVILMEEELYHFSKFPNMTFVQFFCEALHHYSALLDSLITSFSGGYKMGLKMIEKDLLGLRVSDCLRQFPNGMREHWRDGFSSLKGFSPIPMSFSNVTQAKLLVGLFHGGYRVQHDKCRLSLCWKSRPLTTASVWVPNLA